LIHKIGVVIGQGEAGTGDAQGRRRNTEVLMFFVAVALAVFVGIALGLLGGGGSILTLPILRYALGMEGHSAIAVSLLVVGTTSLAALIPHARAGRVRWRTGLIFGGAGMAGAYFAGHRLAPLIPETVLLVGFGIMMFVTAVAMLRGRRVPKNVQAPTELPVFKVIAEGLVVGAVTGLVGAGGGFLVVPALVILGGLPMEAAVGTSLVVISLKSFAGFAGFAGHTPVDYQVALSVAAAAVAGSVVGGRLAGMVPPERLRTGFGWFVIVMAFFILAQEVPAALGTHTPILAAIGIAIGGTAVIAAVTTAVARLRTATA
jgi:uncharacterized membrane protein YfcA